MTDVPAQPLATFSLHIGISEFINWEVITLINYNWGVKLLSPDYDLYYEHPKSGVILTMGTNQLLPLNVLISSTNNSAFGDN